jgi:hypothetical protein
MLQDAVAAEADAPTGIGDRRESIRVAGRDSSPQVCSIPAGRRVARE